MNFYPVTLFLVTPLLVTRYCGTLFSNTRLYVCIFLRSWLPREIENLHTFQMRLGINCLCRVYTGRQAQTCCWVYTKIFNFNFFIIMHYLHQLQLVNTIILLTENHTWWNQGTLKKIYSTYKGHKSERTFLLSVICLILTPHCQGSSKRFEEI